MKDSIITIPEVAEYPKMSKSKIYLMVQRGEIPAVRIGRNVRVVLSDLEKWAESQKQSVSPT